MKHFHVKWNKLNLLFLTYPYVENFMKIQLSGMDIQTDGHGLHVRYDFILCKNYLKPTSWSSLYHIHSTVSKLPSQYTQTVSDLLKIYVIQTAIRDWLHIHVLLTSPTRLCCVQCSCTQYWCSVFCWQYCWCFWFQILYSHLSEVTDWGGWSFTEINQATSAMRPYIMPWVCLPNLTSFIIQIRLSLPIHTKESMSFL